MESCIVEQTIYDNYDNLALRSKDTDSGLPPILLSDTAKYDANLLNGRGISIAEIQYSRLVSGTQNSWNENALSQNGCNQLCVYACHTKK